MRQVQIAQAKAQLSSLLEQVEAGEEIIIARRGKPIARLIPERHADRSAADVLSAVRAMGGFDLEAPAEPQADKRRIDLD